jgi:hypothetical protein
MLMKTATHYLIPMLSGLIQTGMEADTYMACPVLIGVQIAKKKVVLVDTITWPIIGGAMGVSQHCVVTLNAYIVLSNSR